MPANRQQSYDAIVVGAGVIGLACAWRAVAAGARVLVVDRSEPGRSGATSVAAGMLAPVGELQFGERPLLEMTLASAAMFQDFVAELEGDAGRDAGYRRLGALHVALDRDEAAELRRRHELQRSLGLEAHWLEPRRCRDLEPGLSPSFHGGVQVPDEAVVDPRRLSAALLAALENRGTEVRRGVTVEEAGLDGPGISSVRLSDGSELQPRWVVLAAGAWSGQVDWLPATARPPVRPVKGQILELRGAAAEPVCERIVASERVYVVPREDGRVVIGATVEERGFDETVTAGGVHELLREAYRLLPDVAELALVEAAAGLRPGTPDNLPLVGRGALDNLLLATGHYRNGVLLAPLTAEAVAGLIGGASPAGPMRAASPQRLAEPEPLGVPG